jgi:mannose-6-phosphate isomerase-like protein (cupin superfamily)
MEKYLLSGGGVVTVFKPFGGGHYIALVEQDGGYPAQGFHARNLNRREFSVVLDGTFEYELDGEKVTLSPGESILVPSEVPYKISGSGRVLVMVDDQDGGRTEIVAD